MTDRHIRQTRAKRNVPVATVKRSHRIEPKMLHATIKLLGRSQSRTQYHHLSANLGQSLTSQKQINKNLLLIDRASIGHGRKGIVSELLERRVHGIFVVFVKEDFERAVVEEGVAYKAETESVSEDLISFGVGGVGVVAKGDIVDDVINEAFGEDGGEARLGGEGALDEAAVFKGVGDREGGHLDRTKGCC